MKDRGRIFYSNATWAVAGAMIGSLIGSFALAVWHPNLGNLDVLVVVEVVFAVILTAVTIIAALRLSDWWTDAETRVRILEQDLRTKQKEVAVEAIKEDHLKRDPKYWQLAVLGLVMGFVTRLLLDNVFRWSVYQEMMRDYLKSKSDAGQKEH